MGIRDLEGHRFFIWVLLYIYFVYIKKSIFVMVTTEVIMPRIASSDSSGPAPSAVNSVAGQDDGQTTVAVTTGTFPRNSSETALEMNASGTVSDIAGGAGKTQPAKYWERSQSAFDLELKDKPQRYTSISTLDCGPDGSGNKVRCLFHSL